MPDDRFAKNLLFDFYGGLLTEKQREYFSMHYMEDLSLAEIGEQSGITPQAVADLLKRTCALLTKYDQKMLLVEKLQTQRLHAKKINEQLTAIILTAKTADLNDLIKLTESIRESVNEMVL